MPPMPYPATHTETAPAKLNLFLELLGRRPDGYHDLVGVFHEIPALHDTLSAAPDEGLALTIERVPPAPADPADAKAWAARTEDIATGADNLVLRALSLLRETTGIRDGLRVVLRKAVPVAAGMGGGSSDAAAALRLGNRIWRCGLSTPELAELGAKIGSDVPFFLYGGTCLCEGRGERVTPLPDAARGLSAWGFALASPPWTVATAQAYRAYASRPAEARPTLRDASRFIDALAAGDAHAVAALAFNRFAELIDRLAPRQAALANVLRSTGFPGPWLSGSGPTMWSFDPDPPAATEARRRAWQDAARRVDALPLWLSGTNNRES